MIDAMSHLINYSILYLEAHPHRQSLSNQASRGTYFAARSQCKVVHMDLIG